MSPDFATEAEAMEYAKKVMEQLKAMGYIVTLEVHGLDPETTPAASPASVSGDVPQVEAPAQDTGASEEVLNAWLSSAGAGTDEEPGQDKPDTALEPAPTLVIPPPVTQQDVTGDHLVTPLTSDLWDRARKAGAMGTPLLIGGEDLEDMQATVVVYRGYGPLKDKEWPVVWMKVRPTAEDKLMAAVAAAQGMQYTTVVKEVPTYGRAPFDEKEGVAEKLVKYAKSINYHVKDGTPIPSYTIQGVSDLLTYLTQVEQDPTLSEGERALLAGYQKDVQELAEAIQKGTQTPRKDYGPRQGTYTRKVEQKIPIPVDPNQGPGFTVEVRDGTRLDADANGGIAYWDGHKRAKHYGKEIVIDFGDGWTAIYHPHASQYKVPWSYQGTLEIHAPPGADPAGITEHLQRLYLQGAPMSKQEAEAIYLERNAWAQGLTKDPEYKAIQQYVQLRRQELAAELVLTGDYSADDAGMAAAVLQAERKVLPEKISLLRRFFEKKLGLPEGSLPKHPRYRPEPIWEGSQAGGEGRQGFFVWSRFDVDPAEVRAMFGNRVIGHHLTGNKLENLRKIILGGGMLAAQEKRWQMGAKPSGYTMSPEDDQWSGGAAYIFLRVGSPGKFDIEWDPEILLERSDWFFRDTDNFGATNPNSYHYTVDPSTDPAKAAKASKSNNEIAFKNGINLFGRYAPRRIRVGPKHRDTVIGWFKEAGITHLGGRPVEEVVE